jgi:isoleucyl-tRNA synthetase
MLQCLTERLAPVMPYLAQELYNELNLIGLKKKIYWKKRLTCLFLENKDNKINDIFENQFTFLDKELTEISPELASAMSIVLHLRNTYHGVLQSRRAILFDIILYLSDKAKIQVKKRIFEKNILFVFFNSFNKLKLFLENIHP